MTHLSLLRLALLAALVSSVAGAARAQVGVSASIDSEDELQGVSLSEGRPVASVSLAYDAKGGAYGGGTLMAEATSKSGLQPFGYLVYVGYSGRLAGDTSWDIGLTNSGISQVLDKRYSDDYTQVYVGVTRKALSFHAYYTRRYIGERRAALYFELDGAIKPAQHWRLFAHAGLLADLGASTPSDSDRFRVDGRVGLAREFKNLEVRLAVTATSPAASYPSFYRQPANHVVLGATAFF